MSWREKLQERRAAAPEVTLGDSLTKLTQPRNDHCDEPTKLTKPGSVSFVGGPSDHFENIESPTTQGEPVLQEVRTRLLELAKRDGIDPLHIYRMLDRDPVTGISLDDPQCKPFLRPLADSAIRYAGCVPEADTAAIYCHRCGPVWVHPTLAAMLFDEGGWPSTYSCPWCFVRMAGGCIPRATGTHADCNTLTPDVLGNEVCMGEEAAVDRPRLLGTTDAYGEPNASPEEQDLA